MLAYDPTEVLSVVPCMVVKLAARVDVLAIDDNKPELVCILDLAVVPKLVSITVVLTV